MGEAEYVPHVDRLDLYPDTLVFDRADNRDVMMLAGHVVLPIGATIELENAPGRGIGFSARVVGVRIANHDWDQPATLVLDVQIPAEWWEPRDEPAPN